MPARVKPGKRRARPAGPPASLTSEAGRFAWWRARATRGDGAAMVEVAQRLERGRGVEQSPTDALAWYVRAVHAGVPGAPALVGETLFEADPVTGIAWLMLAFERTPQDDDANAVLAATLSLHEPRLTDEAIHAAQVLADACRERECWPDGLATRARVTAPFRPRPPPPPLPARTPVSVDTLTKVVRFGPWRCLVPPAASVETVLVGRHLRATWGGVFAQHLVWATLAPGVDLEQYVRRSLGPTARLWSEDARQRFLLRGLDTIELRLSGRSGTTSGQRALKRFTASGDQVAVLTAVAPTRSFEAKTVLLEALADSVEPA